MARFAIIDGEQVVNIVEWDDESRVAVEYPGLTAVASDEAIVGWKWDGSTLSEPFAETQALSLIEIDAMAEDSRRKNLPPGTGQALTYERKRDEAIRLQNDPSPQEALYPFLSASKGIDGDTIADVAAAVLTKADELAARFASIERIRLKAKKDIRDATTIAEINQIKAALVWPNWH